MLGLKWEDVRFDQLELKVTRSVSRQVVTPCKTDVSRKPIPMNAGVLGPTMVARLFSSAKAETTLGRKKMLA